MAPRRRRAALVALALLRSADAFAVAGRGLQTSPRTTTHAAANDYDLADKRVLVTGASGGIGAAIAVALGARGCRLALHYNSREEGVLQTAKRVEEAGGTVDAIVRADFRSKDAVDGVWAHLDGVWSGGIDVLVNNAGVVTKCASDDSAAGRLWEDTFQINCHAPFHLACAAKNRGVKRVSMISSVHASKSVEYMAAYAASKAALERMTACLAAEWAADGVLLHSVAPGPVVVERTRRVMETPEADALWAPHLPLGRFGTVEEVADTVIFALESRAASWMTGHTITIDGGMLSRANMPVRPRPKIADEPPAPSAAATSLARPAAAAAAPSAAAPSAAEARARAIRATAEFGPTSIEAAEAWDAVSDIEKGLDKKNFPSRTLTEECDVSDEESSAKCRKLADDLIELDLLIARGPGTSALREAAKRMLREIEDKYDPFKKKD
ncbi:hypothetical protein M885DRAFT_521950 [Pelagophyceae sp. CCMP2097]|nr:hypothetical protein M885DRAFT_521950 [Pelagophyceae sp. CCMP2097]